MGFIPVGPRNVWKISVGCPNCLSKPSDLMPPFCCWHQQLSTQNRTCRAGGSLRGVRTILWGGKEGIRHSGSLPSFCSLKGTQGRRTWVDLCCLRQRGRAGGCSITCLHLRFLCYTRISCSLMLSLWVLWLFLPVRRAVEENWCLGRVCALSQGGLRALKKSLGSS